MWDILYSFVLLRVMPRTKALIGEKTVATMNSSQSGSSDDSYLYVSSLDDASGELIFVRVASL
jgi:hypothetical protein